MDHSVLKRSYEVRSRHSSPLSQNPTPPTSVQQPPPHVSGSVSSDGTRVSGSPGGHFSGSVRIEPSDIPFVTRPPPPPPHDRLPRSGPPVALRPGPGPRVSTRVLPVTMVSRVGVTVTTGSPRPGPTDTGPRSSTEVTFLSISGSCLSRPDVPRAREDGVTVRHKRPPFLLGRRFFPGLDQVGRPRLGPEGRRRQRTSVLRRSQPLSRVHTGSNHRSRWDRNTSLPIHSRLDDSVPSPPATGVRMSTDSLPPHGTGQEGGRHRWTDP